MEKIDTFIRQAFHIQDQSTHQRNTYPLHQKGIIKIPNGILFDSNRGIFILDRGLATNYFGQNVEDLKGSRVVDSIQHPELQDVRLLLDTGQVVIYNYHLDLWFLSADRNIASFGSP